MKNVINWFEIPVSDLNRAVQFYNSIFRIDLTITSVGGLMAPFPHDSNGVGGALVLDDANTPSSTGSLVYLNAGEDLRVVLNRVEPAGGKILQKRTLISEGIGYMAIFLDSEGNRIALHSPY